MKVTSFPDKVTTQGVQVDVTPGEALMLPFWSPAIFTGDNRGHGAEVLECAALAYDLDQGQPEAAVRAIMEASGYIYALGASRNHQVDKPGQGVRDRLRLVVPLTRPASANEYLLTHRVLKQALGLVSDPGADGVARGWFACKALLIETPRGRTVDPIAPVAEAGSHTDSEAPIRNPRQWGARAIASAIEEIQGAAHGDRDRTMNRNAYGMGRLIAPCGLERDKVVELLVDTAVAAGYDAHKALDCCNRAVDAGMNNPREVAASPSPAAVQGDPVRHNGQPAPVDQLRPCPPKPGAAPADLTGAAGQRWLAAQTAYSEWQRDLRTVLDARLVTIGYDQTRVLYVRRGLRRVEVLGTAHRQAGVIIQVAGEGGLLVGAGKASEMAEEYLRCNEDRVVQSRPTLWDTGDGLYLYESPKVEAGPTPTWDTLLERMSDADAFLAHVWSVFEPRFKGRQVLWLQGGGNDGKSIAFDALFADCPVAALSDADLTTGNQFVFSSVWDKPAVLIGESKNVNVLMTGMVHKLTGRDIIPVEYKHGQRFPAKFQGVVFVTSNNHPQIERTRSNLTRLSVVTIRPGGWVDDLPSRLRREVPALLDRARLAYAVRCPRHFEIHLNAEAQEALTGSTSHEEEQNATAFAMTGLRIEGDDFLARTEVFKRLVASGSKLADVNKVASFYRWLAEQPGVKETTARGVRGYRGVKP